MQYIELYDLNKTGSVKLVKDPVSGELFVQKKLKVYDLSIYEFLIKNKPAGIPRMHSYEPTPDGLLVIEEYINGRTLTSLLEESGPPPLDISLNYIYQICAILSPLHKNNPAIVHRDIKPSNILITYQGIIYLLDFNAATKYNEDKDSDTVLIGTTGYAAPEQYGFKASDPRADIYALGRTAEELFIGEKPSPENYNGPFPEIIKKCLQIDPVNRYSDAAELLNVFKSLNSNHFESNHFETSQFDSNHSDQSMPKKEVAIKQPSNNSFITKYIYNSLSSDEIKLIHRNSWLPPGYRTKTPWKMIISTIFYGFWILGLWGSFENKSPSSVYGDIVAIVFLVLELLFITNYKGIQFKLPLTRSTELLYRILGIVLYVLLIYVLVIVFYNLTTSLITLS